jgi:hypothetical protein
MKLTPVILKEIYEVLSICEPFDKWNMPYADEIKFEVTQDMDCMGTYLYDDGSDFEHTITISAARCGHLDTVIRTMAHEMIHCSRHGTVTDAWLKHDKTFRNRAKKVSQAMGFDEKEL